MQSKLESFLRSAKQAVISALALPVVSPHASRISPVALYQPGANSLDSFTAVFSKEQALIVVLYGTITHPVRIKLINKTNSLFMLISFYLNFAKCVKYITVDSRTKNQEYFY